MPSLRTLLRSTLSCGLAIFAHAAGQSQSTRSLDWDHAFIDRSGPAPLHFIATYSDARGSHRLEEWRTGILHLRRRTDNRIDLYADMTSKPLRNAGEERAGAEYAWQILDLDHKIVNRISSAGMLHAGMFYSFYSMAHVVSRPAGNFRLTAVPDAPLRLAGLTCTWFQIAPDAQPAQRICWSPAIGAPLATRSQQRDSTWTTDFKIQTIDRSPIPASTYLVNAKGLRVRDLDAIEAED